MWNKNTIKQVAQTRTEVYLHVGAQSNSPLPPNDEMGEDANVSPENNPRAKQWRNSENRAPQKGNQKGK